MTTPDPTRRRLLNWLLSPGSGGLFGVLLYPIVRYMTPPAAPEAASASVVAGKVKDFPPNSGKIVRFGEKPAIVGHLASSEFRVSLPETHPRSCRPPFVAMMESADLRRSATPRSSGRRAWSNAWVYLLLQAGRGGR